MKNCMLYETLGSVTEMKVTNENGLMTLSGTFGVCGTRNRNNRVYEKSNYSKCVNEMKKRIAEDGGVPGELEHPETMNITLENISHKITDINIDESGVVTGTIQLLNTPKGLIAQKIVEGGLPLFVSSRAMGKVDKNGNVTLECISSYDLVGTPGFAEARMHLNESQVFESLDEGFCMIVDKEEVEEIKENNENNNDMTNEELLERLETLENRIQELGEANERLQEEVDEAKAGNIDLQKLAEGIQKWVVEEYTSTLENWMKDEFGKYLINENKKVFVSEIAPKIQQWVVEEFAPTIQDWVCEQYSGKVEQWVLEQVAPGIQGWAVEHFAPEMEKWVNENYSLKVKDMISESITSSKDSKLKSISETLALLESIDVKKPEFGGRMIRENKTDEPMYVQNMPEQFRPKYNMASQEVKESIARRAKLYDFATEGALERFWESINFDEIKPATAVNENLDMIEDARERAIRAQFRRRRHM